MVEGRKRSECSIGFAFEPVPKVLGMSRPALIAHRGASAHCPENTLAAFERAIAEGADWIELDLQPVRDGVAVFHDDELLRLTGRPGRIHELEIAALAELDVRVEGRSAPSPQQVPSLQQVLEEIAPRCPLYVELKSDGLGLDSPRNRRLLERVFAAFAPESPHVLASFDPALVTAAHERGHRGVLILAQMEALDRLPAEMLFAWSARHHLLDEGIAERARRAGVPLWIWTVDRREDIERALSAGAAGICSNDVPLARAVLDGRSS